MASDTVRIAGAALTHMYYAHQQHLRRLRQAQQDQLRRRDFDRARRQAQKEEARRRRRRLCLRVEPLQHALSSGTAILSAAARGWLTTACGDQPSPASNRRALAEAIVIGLFWIVASVCDVQLTYARLMGSDPSAAYSSTSDNANWIIACVFVASIGLYASTYLAVGGIAGHTAWFGERDQRWIRSILVICFAVTIICALSLGLVTQEAADGIDDPVLRDLFTATLVLNTVGAVGIGKFVVSRLLALAVAAALWSLWLPLAGLALILRLVRTSAPSAPPAFHNGHLPLSALFVDDEPTASLAVIQRPTEDAS